MKYGANRKPLSIFLACFLGTNDRYFTACQFPIQHKKKKTEKNNDVKVTDISILDADSEDVSEVLSEVLTRQGHGLGAK